MSSLLQYFWQVLLLAILLLVWAENVTVRTDATWHSFLSHMLLSHVISNVAASLQHPWPEELRLWNGSNFLLVRGRSVNTSVPLVTKPGPLISSMSSNPCTSMPTTWTCSLLQEWRFGLSLGTKRWEEIHVL